MNFDNTAPSPSPVFDHVDCQQSVHLFLQMFPGRVQSGPSLGGVGPHLSQHWKHAFTLAENLQNAIAAGDTELAKASASEFARLKLHCVVRPDVTDDSKIK